MPSIDKIYGTYSQLATLHDFLADNKPEYLKYLYVWDWPLGDDNEHPIANFTEGADLWLAQHCPLDFVQERLAEQYQASLAHTISHSIWIGELLDKLRKIGGILVKTEVYEDDDGTDLCLYCWATAPRGQRIQHADDCQWSKMLSLTH